MSEQNYIIIRGAREHNLKNVNIDLPRGKFIVITGLSGSGKTSLAFDTIYAEGQRRYVESLSAYARQFLEIMQKPEIDRIDGLSPAISLEQKTTGHNPRSTVGTITEIYDYMRLLFARVGTPYSPVTGLKIESQTVSEMVDRVMALPQGTRLLIMAPIVRGRKGEYRKEFAELQKKGFQRVKIDGVFYEITDIPALDKKYKHDIDVVVDRVVVRDDLPVRLADSLEICLRLSDGLAIAEFADMPHSQKSHFFDKVSNDTHEKILFSAKFSCPVSGFTISEIEPRLFSFNSPFGACSACDGLGVNHKIDPALITPIDELSLEEGALVLWNRLLPYSHCSKLLETLGKEYHFQLSDSWNQLSSAAQQAILYGTRKKKNFYSSSVNFDGIIALMEQRWKKADTPAIKEEFSPYMSTIACSSCHGYRLKEEALIIKIADCHIGEVSAKSILEAENWFGQIETGLTDKQRVIALPILKEICERLRFLKDVGLQYLTLDRVSGTLSGGESQRIRLASQIGSGLTGVLYILDEPSIGLHQRDNARLLDTLRHLRDLGNTIIVVEHDEDAILSADYVVDMGPLAGLDGGMVVAHGTPQEIKDNPESLTGQYLSGKKKISLPKQRRAIHPDRQITVTGACGNNLKNVNASIPLGVFSCVTGVSGSGKSTFLIETIFKAASRFIMKSREQPASYHTIKGLELLDKVIDIDQSPIGRTPRSNPATYTGAFTPIRDWFAALPEAKARGYRPGRFSFNVKGGRCEACQGDGVTKIEMHFLPDLYVTCDICHGKRYNRETLEIRFKDKSIADILEMTIEEGLDFFSAVPAVKDKLAALVKVGLGYIKIGQRATTLSGGEAQRVKLAKELARKATGSTLYILDEPTTGLHFHDVAKLLDILQELVDQGNSVVIIEHNLEVIKTADWVIDFGPEGGDEGGEMIASGTPEDIVKEKQSYTGQFLQTLLKKT